MLPAFRDKAHGMSDMSMSQNLIVSDTGRLNNTVETGLRRPGWKFSKMLNKFLLKNITGNNRELRDDNAETSVL